MLRHFFREEDEPTWSCTPNSLRPQQVESPPILLSSMPLWPLHVLELWPLFPQLEHFLAIPCLSLMDGTRTQENEVCEEPRNIAGHIYRERD
jgi:hypothetical protein